MLSGVIVDSEIFWIGNDWLVFKGFPPGHNHQRNLYAWDMRGPARMILAHSDGLCVAGGKVFTHRDKPSGRSERVSLEAPDFRPVPIDDDPSNSRVGYVNKSTCGFAATPKYFFGRFWRPLQNGDGFLDFGPDNGRPERGRIVYHMDAALGKKTDTGIRMNAPLIPAAVAATDGSYIIYDVNFAAAGLADWREGSGFLRIWRLGSDRVGRPLDVPYGPWADESTRFIPAKNGIILVGYRFGSNRIPVGAGAYLLFDQGGVVRLERGAVGDGAVSADGCKFAYSYQFRLGEDFAYGGRSLVVVGLC